MIYETTQQNNGGIHCGRTAVSANKLKPWTTKAHVISHLFVQSHGITLVHYCHLCCNAMQSSRKVPKYEGNLLPSQGTRVVVKLLYPGGGGSKLLQYIGTLASNYRASHPRRQ
jgi:hypothetical protein